MLARSVGRGLPTVMATPPLLAIMPALQSAPPAIRSAPAVTAPVVQPAAAPVVAADLGPAPLPDDYWVLARRPLNCLCFLLPLLVVYEVGVLWLGGDQSESLRNGADCWIRGALQSVGVSHVWLVPVAVTSSLLVWQAASGKPWRVSPETWMGMLAESFLFAFLLVIIGQLQGLAFKHWEPVPADVTATVSRGISFLGAGIYEEVLFRLCLLPACYGVWRLLMLPHTPAAGLAILVSSLLFAAAHYVGPAGEPFTAFTFTFRAIAGLFFAILFVLRGFGIAAGCHATYDLLVGIFLAQAA